jgi:FSR family fosmidomycin resistance protein-like MFS transporter
VGAAVADCGAICTVNAHRSHTLRRTVVFTLTLLLIEFLDEFVFGAREAAWPLIRTDLGLSYAQVGLLLGVPNIVGNLVEPVIGILGDVWKRRLLILGGGFVFTLALLLTVLSQSFLVLLISFVLFSPASGAFVSLSQATLMDLNPDRHEQNMARWVFAGSVGVVAGSLALGAATALGMGWRGLYFVFAGLTLILLMATYRIYPMGLSSNRNGWERIPGLVQDHPQQVEDSTSSGRATFVAGAVNALRALRRPAVLRWLTLLAFSDLMLDVLLGFLALYFVDVVGATPAQAGIAVAVWTGLALLGDLLLIPLLERVQGLDYLRLSAAVELILFPIFLLAPGFWTKVGILGLLGLFNAGWYSILKAQLYSTMPGQSGTVMAVGNVFGLLGGLIPFGLGLIAERFDLTVTLWLLLLGPVALLIGIPKIAGKLRTCRREPS